MSLPEKTFPAAAELLHWDNADGRPANQMGAILSRLIDASKQLDVLTGFFYFNGIPEVADALDRKVEAGKPFTLRILVGMEAEIGTRAFAREILEYGPRADLTAAQRQTRYARTLLEILRTTPGAEKTNSDRQLYDRLVQMLHGGTVSLEIRQTRRSNHGKLYLFHPEEASVAKSYILGSSNFSKQGLKDRHELNFRVEQDPDRADELAAVYDRLWTEGSDAIIEVKPKVGSPEDIPAVITPAVLAAHSPYRRPTPFEAYMALMKRYLGESAVEADLEKSFRARLALAGYQPMQYQLKGAAKAIKILDHHGGVIVADAVGLGKSVTAALIATQAHPGGGVIIVPATLVGDWKTDYLTKFDLHATGRPWAVFSMTDLTAAAVFCKENAVGMVIVDEAHRFRNPNIKEYEVLRQLCHGRKVVLLTATPFNNAPSDLAALVGLFSARYEQLNGDAATKVFDYIVEQDARYRELVFLQRNLDRQSPPITVEALRAKLRTKYSALKTKKDISAKLSEIGDDLLEKLRPYLVRRNRSDLRNNPDYHENGSALRMPSQVVTGRYYTMSSDQQNAYIAVLNAFQHSSSPGHDASTGFACTIYRVAEFVQGDDDGNYLDNYRSMTLRHLLRRFESSPYAFKRSVQDLIQRHEEALRDLTQSSKLYFNPKGLELVDDEDDLDSADELTGKVYCRSGSTAAGVRFKEGQDGLFIEGLERDLDSLKTLLGHAEVLLQNDAKVALLKEIIGPCVAQQRGEADPLLKQGALPAQVPALPVGAPRRIVLFTMFIDTARHLAQELARTYGPGMVMLAMDKQATSPTALDLGRVQLVHTAQEVKHCFDVKSTNDNVWTAPRILITTDKFSEGVNLNRAGLLVNYDIPWNPVRVIQRLGRINRINACWFEHIYVFNLYPEAQRSGVQPAGHGWASAKDIAAQKLILIHRLFFEDATILGDSEAGGERPFEALDKAASADSEPPSEETLVQKLYQEALRSVGGDDAFEKRLLAFGMGMKTVRLGQAQANMVIFKQVGAQIQAWALDELRTADSNRRAARIGSFLGALKLIESVPGERRPEPDRYPDEYEDVEKRMATPPSTVSGTDRSAKGNSSRNRALAATDAWTKRPDLLSVQAALVALDQSCDSYGLSSGLVSRIAAAGASASRKEIDAILSAAAAAQATGAREMPAESSALPTETILTFVNDV